MDSAKMKPWQDGGDHFHTSGNVLRHTGPHLGMILSHAIPSNGLPPRRRH